PLSSSCPFHPSAAPRHPPSFPTRRSSDLASRPRPFASALSRTSCTYSASRSSVDPWRNTHSACLAPNSRPTAEDPAWKSTGVRRSEEHTSELQSRENLVCRLLLEKKK